jgi:hypothetical protein
MLKKPGSGSCGVWSASLPSIYHDLREAITLCINPAHHPGPQFDKLEAAFGRISNTIMEKGHMLSRSLYLTLIQALIAMAAIPQKWENLIPIICNSFEIQDLEVLDLVDIRHQGHRKVYYPVGRK